MCQGQFSPLMLTSSTSSTLAWGFLCTLPILSFYSASAELLLSFFVDPEAALGKQESHRAAHLLPCHAAMLISHPAMQQQSTQHRRVLVGLPEAATTR